MKTLLLRSLLPALPTFLVTFLMGAAAAFAAGPSPTDPFRVSTDHAVYGVTYDHGRGKNAPQFTQEITVAVLSEADLLAGKSDVRRFIVSK